MNKTLIDIIRFFPRSYHSLRGCRARAIGKAPEGCRARIAVIADLHLRTTFKRKTLFEMGLRDFEKAKQKLDAFVITGDITDHGYPEMWEAFTRIFTRYSVSQNDILVIGNHDTWGFKENEIENTRETFCKYSLLATGRKIDRNYFATDAGGYRVIALGSEGDRCEADVSDEQIKWLSDELDACDGSGKPVFIFFHQSVNGTHGLPYTWEFRRDDPIETGGIGERSDEILDIIKKHKNIVYTSGHIHEGFALESENKGYTSLERHGSYSLINIPCYIAPDKRRGGYEPRGTGYIYEIYDDKIILRARNFAYGADCPQYDETIELSR